ncbi:MAG: T9SS type A sorting domain-containing protein [Bacteroidota bacterium]
MKTLRYSFYLITIITWSACGDAEKKIPKSSFDNVFPKRHKDLTNIFGDQLTIKKGDDILVLNISSFKNYNLIKNNQTGETLFYGTVSKFRGLFYFSQQLNDTSYWIYAVKLNDDLIYGLNTAFEQTILLDEAIENNKHQKLVKYTSSDIFRLHPEKKELRSFFTSIIENIVPDTILRSPETFTASIDTTSAIAPIDPEDFAYFSKVYPNPTADFITIELQQKDKIDFQLIDLNGKIVLEGQFNENINKIDLTKLQDGIFSLTIVNPGYNQRERIKIIKAK